MKVSNKQWSQAQEAERACHSKTLKNGKELYKHTYEQYFKYLGMSFDLDGRKVMEIGPADYPAIAYCHNIGPFAVIVEPMPSQALVELVKINTNYILIKEKAETMPFNMVHEVWLFNVLQHTQDPDRIINKAMQSCEVIRFFEPINYGTDACHLHNFTLEYFKNHFGDAVQHYKGDKHAKNFHTHECAFGSYYTGRCLR